MVIRLKKLYSYKKQIIFLVFLIALLAGAFFIYYSFSFTQDIGFTTSSANNISLIAKDRYDDLRFIVNPPGEANTTYYTTINFNLSGLISRYSGKSVTIKLYSGNSETNINNEVKTITTTVNAGAVNLTNGIDNNARTYYRLEAYIDGAKLDIRENNFAGNVTINLEKVFHNNYVFSEDVREYAYTIPMDGEYVIELWGAKGNYYAEQYLIDEYRAIAGNGAYTKGTIRLYRGDVLYFNLGKNAVTLDDYSTESYNGGSVTLKGWTNGHYMSSGGGASDVRLVSAGGNWKDLNSLASRIMVAAGGGGTLYQDTESFTQKGSGGSGGGLIGYKGDATYIRKSDKQKIPFSNGGVGGKQKTAGLGSTFCYSSYLNGGFGIGGNGGRQEYMENSGLCRATIRNYITNNGGNYDTTCGETGCGDAFYTNELLRTGNIGGGGGGGWYGGGGGSMAEDCHYGGAGGSSYISGHTGSISYANASNPACTESGDKPENYFGTTNKECGIYTQNGRRYEFYNTLMIDGEGYCWTTKIGNKCNMPKPGGGYYTEKGHQGSGAGSIYRISPKEPVANATWTKQIWEVTIPELDIKADIKREDGIVKSKVDVTNISHYASCTTVITIPIDPSIENIRNIKVTSPVSYTPNPAVVANGKIVITLTAPFLPNQTVSITYDADQKSNISAKKINLDPVVTWYPSRENQCTPEVIKELGRDEYKGTDTDHDDTPVVGDLKIIKIDADTNERLEKVRFNLYDASGNLAKDCYGKLVGELSTNVAGEIIVKDLLYTTYYLKEVSSVDGYYVLSESIPVEVSKTYTEITVKNKPLKISVLKKDYFTNESLKGATIVVYDINNENIYKEFITKTDKIELQIVPGKYLIKELIAPDGYQVNDEAYEVEVTDKGFVVVKDEEVIWEGGNYELNIYDEPTKLSIVKQDIKNGKILIGAEIAIYDEKGEIAKDTISNEEIHLITTKEETKWYYLKPGKYVLKELKAPKNYEVIEEELKFEVTANGTLVPDGEGNDYLYLESNRLTLFNGFEEIPIPNTGLYIGIFTVIVGGVFIYLGYRLTKKKKDDIRK